MEESPRSAERLEAELQQARAKLYDSQHQIESQKLQLSQEQLKNSDLKGQTARWGDLQSSPGVNQFDLQLENNELEKRLRELESELRLERANQQGGQFSPASPRALESRYQDANPYNFLEKNQGTQLEHLLNLKKILEDGTNRFRDQLESKNLLTEADLLQLRSNMNKVKQEIDSILRAKVRMNERYSNMAGRIEVLQRENESLRSSQSRASDTSHLGDISRELANRNAKIAELTTELAALKSLVSRQVSSSDLVSELLSMKKDLDSKTGRIFQLEQSVSSHLKNQLNLTQTNQTLSSQLVAIKAQVDAIDPSRIKRDMEDAASRISGLQKENKHLRQNLESSKDTIGTLRQKVATLEAERAKVADETAAERRFEGLQRTPGAPSDQGHSRVMVTPKPFAGGSEQQNPQTDNKRTAGPTGSTAIEDFTAIKSSVTAGDLRDSVVGRQDGELNFGPVDGQSDAMGLVSTQEMVKLEERIKEFGECNQDLEDLIYKVKHFILGMDDADLEPNEIERDYDHHLTPTRGDRHSKKADMGHILEEVSHMKDIVMLLARDKQKERSPPRQDSVQAQMLMQLELMRMQNKKQEEVDIRVHMLMQENKKLVDDITELKAKLRDAEIKSNTLSTLNMQLESQIERLLQQIHDNKDYFKKLITENETVKVRERDILKELTNSHNKLQTLQDELHDTSKRQSMR